MQKFIQECATYQRSKSETLAPGRLLHPLPILDIIWEQVSMDFISGLPNSHRYDTILVVVDRLSKYSDFILLKHPYTSRHIAEIFINEVVRLHGIPKSILSDQDPIFMRKFWQELFYLQGITLHMTSSYHPQSDGQTEVVNRCLETLRCFAIEQPQQWSYWIP